MGTGCRPGVADGDNGKCSVRKCGTWVGLKLYHNSNWQVGWGLAVFVANGYYCSHDSIDQFNSSPRLEVSIIRAPCAMHTTEFSPAASSGKALDAFGPVCNCSNWLATGTKFGDVLCHSLSGGVKMKGIAEWCWVLHLSRCLLCEMLPVFFCHLTISHAE